MISRKSKREIELMKQAGKIVAITHRVLRAAIKPGVTTKQLDDLAYKTIVSYGATPSFKGYGGFPGSICTSINEKLVHGIPDNTKLKDGDIISIDIGANYKGYHGDSAWTYAVGEVSEEARKLMEVTEQALFKGLELVKPNNRIGDIGHAIQQYVEQHGYSLPIDYTGHGIGLHLHEDPAVPNIGRPNTLEVLKEGMCLAIEPMVHTGKPHTKVLADNWTVISKDKSLTAHYEHTVVIMADGYEILTKED
ncbi:MAG: type I methionyl aminopeptidase [Erysipelotrichaceae bacterium]